MLERRKVYIKPVGGLCNRMRAVDSCVALGHQLGKKVTVFWGRDTYLNCKFSDLFQPSSHFNVIEENQLFGRKAFYPYLPDSKPTSILKSALFQLTSNALAFDKVIWFEDLDHALLPLRQNIEPAHIQHMKAYESKAITALSPFVKQIEEAGKVFLCSAWRLWPDRNYKKHFVPISILKDKIAETISRFSHTTGVHIRRGDHELARKNSIISKFRDAMNMALDASPDTTFFLATDCDKTEQALANSFRGKIFTYQKQSYNRNSPVGIQDALIDLYCLSKTEKIMGSYFSSFSQVAAEISGLEEITIH